MADEAALDVNEYRSFLPASGLTREEAPAPETQVAQTPPQQGPGYQQFFDQTQAFTPGAPPPAGAPAGRAPPAQQQQPAIDPAAEDDISLGQADELEKERLKILRSHSDGYEEIKPPTDHPDLPRLAKARENLSVIARQSTPAEYRLVKSAVDKFEGKIAKEIAEAHKTDLANRKQQEVQARLHYESPERRTQTAAVSNTALTNFMTERQDRLTKGDDASRKQAEWTNKTSPLSTMIIEGDATRLRDAVTSLMIRNPELSGEAAVRYVMAIGSPVGTQPDGRPGRGANGLTGAGATRYEVIGRAINDSYLLRMPDGRTLVVDPFNYNKLKEARIAGGKVGRGLQAEMDKPKEPSWLGEQFKKIIPRGGF